MERAVQEIHAPIETISVESERAREIYGCDLLLVRPDLHVVWRGNAAPDDAAQLAALATGHASDV